MTTEEKTGELVQQSPKAIVGLDEKGLIFTDIDQLYRFAVAIQNTDLVPDDCKKRPDVILAKVIYGRELGMTPMQSINQICIIKGHPGVYGDALPGIVLRGGHEEYTKEWWEGAGNTLVATCETKRKGKPEPVTRRFSWADATKANLIGKDSYKNYPARMLQCRARAWAFRDVYPDDLHGLGVVEELQDIVPAAPPAGRVPFKTFAKQFPPEPVEAQAAVAPEETPTPSAGEPPVAAEPLSAERARLVAKVKALGKLHQSEYSAMLSNDGIQESDFEDGLFVNTGVVRAYAANLEALEKKGA